MHEFLLKFLMKNTENASFLLYFVDLIFDSSWKKFSVNVITL